MNTKIIVAIIVAIVLLGLGGYFILGKNTGSQTQTPTTTPTPTKSKNMSQSLLDLLTSGKTQKCNFTYTADGASTKGTVYLAGTRMRGDITTVSKDNKTTIIYMIRDGNTNYVWGNSLPTGIKMTLSSDDLKTNTQANQYFNTQQKTNYSCTPWNTDNSMFALPTNVKFTDVSAMMQKTGTTGITGTPNAQSACAKITDPTAKTACENAMHQNGY